MPVEFKDYYTVLGVARDAKDEDIKKAFRKLARLYHPDIAKDKKTAEAKFKEINEANEVLSDPEKRRKYDQLGADWQSGRAGHGPAGGTRQGPNGSQQYDYHFGGTGFSDFFEQFFGGRQRGRGGYEDEMAFAQPGSDIEGAILVTLHEVMNGATRVVSLKRTDPRTGEIETQTFNVRIPAGVHEGQLIRVRGQGHPGSGGAEPGDLYLRVRVEAHPDFSVRGSDLYHELLIAPWEGALGAQLLIPTLSGKIKLRIPPGTNNEQQLRVRGQGLPKGQTGERGDLYVVMNVQLPTDLTAEERAAWEKLGGLSRFNPRSA